MGTMKIGEPIKVKLDEQIEAIDNVSDAADFLQRWPVERRGHIYRSALNACSAAITAQISESDAMKAFTGFARVTGILVTEGGQASMPEAGAVHGRMTNPGRHLPK